MRVLKTKRLDEMEKMIIDRRNVSLKELSQSFGVSMNTIRSDIECILKRGRIKKVYGGVSLADADNPLLEYSLRVDKHKALKQEVCSKAKDLIKDGDIIFIDSGTTTIYLSEYLKDKKDIKVVTNNIVVIASLLPYDNVQVIGIGGKVNHKTRSFASIESMKVIDSYNIQKAFMAASAVSLKNGAMNSSFDEKNVKAMVAKKAENVYLLCDSSKFGKHALLTYCNLDDLDAIITDSKKSEHKKLFIEAGIRVI